MVGTNVQKLIVLTSPFHLKLQSYLFLMNVMTLEKNTVGSDVESDVDSDDSDFFFELKQNILFIYNRY